MQKNLVAVKIRAIPAARKIPPNCENITSLVLRIERTIPLPVSTRKEAKSARASPVRAQL
jgi:hypothetical protein